MNRQKKKEYLKYYGYPKFKLWNSEQKFHIDFIYNWLNKWPKKKHFQRKIGPLLSRELVQLLSHVWLSATPQTAAHQASLSFTISWNLLKLMSIESVMPSNHLILWTWVIPINHWINFSAQVQFSSVQSLSCVRLFATPWIAARQASLSITNSRSSLKLMLPLKREHLERNCYQNHSIVSLAWIPKVMVIQSIDNWNAYNYLIIAYFSSYL